MKLDLRAAVPEEALAIVGFRKTVGEHLAARFGATPVSVGTDRGILYTMKTSTVYIAMEQARVMASLTLSIRKPWAIDKSYFSACKRPLYLTSMAVHPELQGTGVGRQMLAQAAEIAKAWPADAIRLDACDSPMGACAFYTKCGYREVGRVTYRGVALIYFEKSI